MIILFLFLSCTTTSQSIHWLLATDDNFTSHFKSSELLDDVLHKSRRIDSQYTSSESTINITPKENYKETVTAELKNVKLKENVSHVFERGFRPFFPYFDRNISMVGKTQESSDYNLAEKSEKSNIKNRQRFLEVFEVVEFDHDACVSSSGLEGTCLHEFDCQSIEGAPMGTCADGLGTCCVILFACDARSSSLSGWFVNPNFPTPSSERVSCVVSLEKNSDDIKQFRLDFTNFEILPPTNGNCEQDQFSVSGQDGNNIIPILCGINSGQHMYIEVGNTDGPINLSIQTLSEENRLFSIKVTQLTASDALAAPPGCLQHHADDHGHVESFNYRDRSEIGILRSSSYLNNLNYAICIKRSPSTCSITYTNVGEMQVLNYDTDGAPIIPPRQAGVEIYNCPSDWLLLAAVRLCGERLNDGAILQDFSLDAPVTDEGTGPIIVWFRTDGVYTGRGFKLHYQQNSCSTPT